MNYIKLLENSYQLAQVLEGYKFSRLAFLGEQIFGFTTYDSEAYELFGRKALEVCTAINDSETFQYQKKDKKDYNWYLIMVNMPFFTNKLEWGGSIRGAWWDLYGDNLFEIDSCGLWEDDEQLLSIKFNSEQWPDFIKAMNEFVACNESDKS